jgi:hypothetical protein
MTQFPCQRKQIRLLNLKCPSHDCVVIAADDDNDLPRASAKVPPTTDRRPHKIVAAQSPRVIAGDVLGRGSFPDHGVNDARRRSVQDLMIFRTNTTLVSELAGDVDSSTRRWIDESCKAISASTSFSFVKPCTVAWRIKSGV